PDAPARVDEFEECPRVVAHDALANVAHGGLKPLSQLVVPTVPNRTQVTVHHADHLGERERGDQVTASHSLLPANTPTEHEGPVLRETVEHLHDLKILAQVAKQHVAAQLGAVGVEDAEPVTLPLLRGVEVDRRTEMGNDLTALLEVLH